MELEGSSFRCYCYTISFIIISCFLASAAMATVKHSNIISDQDALLSLKARISRDPNQILTKNWSAINGSSSSVCDWIGVSCAIRHYRVKSLNISNMGLTGTIVPQLGNLSFLSSMDLSGNNFQGDLPSELAQLRRLKVLSLSRNALSGEFPSWIGSVNQLESLYLNNNSFTGSIPSSITNLTNLKNLICYQNELSGSIPFQIFNVSSMEHLSFGFNQLHGNLPTTMCPNLQKLSYISLRSNMLSGPLPSDLHRCSWLTYLDLSYNNFSGQIPKTFCNMENLERAFFQYNNLVGTVPKELNNLTNLQALNLGSNHLTGTLPKEVNNLTNLQALGLGSNHVTGIIPEELGNLPNLELLALYDNEMIGTIPEGIFNISSLFGLDLSRNHLTGSLPSATGLGLPNLQFLDIYQNMIGGAVPIFISNCSQLSELDLSANNFKGTIPHFLGNLRSLQTLSLVANKLTKDSSSSLELEFLTPLANCIYLQELQLSFNPLNGILPKSLGNLSNSVAILTIRSCGLSGEIPASIRNLSNLLALDLSHNQFISPFPKSIAFLQNLQFLDMGFIGISGWIPCDLFGLRRLSELYLSYNTFFGPIPDCIGNTTSLRKLYLGSNKLSSSIPMNLWNLNGLLFLNISNNSLSGSLPNQVGNIKDIVSLDLSMNNLSGNIPDAIGSLLSLEELFLDYNLLEGLIPKSIGSAVSLKYLDLSANNLSGSIPVTLEKLRYLERFNASYNNLDGPIPDRGPFTKFTWESFISNKGRLCGEKRFHVSPCHDHASPQKLWTRPHVLILCFGLVATVFAITIIVVYLILGRKNRFRRGEELVQVTAKDQISFYELQHATDGYNERNLLGKGSFGSVYKGTLRDGMVVAVKVFDIITEGAHRSFDVECEMLRNLRHRNLTKVISSCSNLDFKAIVLEFMPNGSLENWLHSGNHFLSFTERVNIMIDVASALQYLHSGVLKPVVHADLKPSNVLLDEDKVAHVCDFGIAKMLGENSITHTNTLATFGYIAPEYGSEGLVSTKCDVYSFGILLMEVFTRKRPDDEMFNESLTLPGWVTNNSTKSALIDIIDESLLNTIEGKHFEEMMDYVMMIMNVALNCTNKFPKERSGMEEIVATLNKIKLKL